MATLPTKGSVLIETTVGDIEIDLWAKVHLETIFQHYHSDSFLFQETPKACRNFIALALEGTFPGYAKFDEVFDRVCFKGYYDGVIFHRVVPNFLVQTGDRTGTGNGGESFYGGNILPPKFFAQALCSSSLKNPSKTKYILAFVSLIVVLWGWRIMEKRIQMILKYVAVFLHENRL